MDFLTRLDAKLNPPQMEAVQTIFGPLLILAGAGSGKTRVLTYRLAHIVASGEAAASQVLAVTFTNKAAKEMNHRVSLLLKDLGFPDQGPLWISTFHSICARILRQEIHLLDYQPFFSIYDDGDQLTMIKKICDVLNLSDKTYPPKAFQARINEAKRLAVGPEEFALRNQSFYDEKTSSVYNLYETEMRKANALDFGDLLFKTYEVMRMYPDILDNYRAQFPFVMVDEYQDTNRIQYLLVKALCDQHRNLCVVGDEDQSIYSWRGADIRNILDFEKDFPEAKVVKLEENYRSSKTIVSAASAVIQNNDQRKDKVLFTSNSLGEKITIREEATEYDEARYVIAQIEALQVSESRSAKDFAVFYRTNAQSRVFEDWLRSRGIAYKIVGGMKFYERLEIKDLLCYLKVLINPTDEIALKRIINSPARGIGKSTVEKVVEVAQKFGTSFFEAILLAADHREVHAGACRKLRAFRLLIDELLELKKTKSLSELYMAVLDRTEYAVRLREENTPESLARVENLEELNNAIHQFEEERGEDGSLQNFLEEMALVSDVDDVDESQDHVTLMTLHISKGLEFPVVFLVGLEDGLFPSMRSFENDDGNSLEEERRLCYVGMTRARERLFMTHARSRRVWGQEQMHPPSRFLKEIPAEYILSESALKRPTSFSERHAQPLAARGPRSLWKDQEAFDEAPQYEEFSDTDTLGSYEKGMKVRHPTFGIGAIFQIEGNGEAQKISVLFNDRTSKKFIAKYARLERVW